MIINYKYVKLEPSENKVKKNEYLHKESYKLLEKILYDNFIDKSVKIVYKYSEYGKPSLYNSDYKFNISYSEEMVCTAISKKEIGIDIELIRKYNESLIKFVLSKDEREELNSVKNKEEYFFRLWTLKESYIKAIGKGLSCPMKNINFRIIGEKILSNVDNYNFYQKIIEIEGRKYIISVAWGDEDELVL